MNVSIYYLSLTWHFFDNVQKEFWMHLEMKCSLAISKMQTSTGIFILWKFQIHLRSAFWYIINAWIWLAFNLNFTSKKFSNRYYAEVWNIFQEQVFLSMVISKLWMNLQETVIKICSEWPRWSPNKLCITS